MIEASQSAHALCFAQLFDDASLFPPAQLTLEPSIELFFENAKSDVGWMVGRYVCPVSQFGELRKVTANRPIRVAVVMDSDGAFETDGVTAVESVELSVINSSDPAEVRVDAAFSRLSARPDYRSLRVYVELPTKGIDLAAALRRISRERAAGIHAAAKVRCGGLSAENAPSPDELATFLSACAAAGVPCKATAGLHHPIRAFHPESGFIMHGFLNVLFAAISAHLLPVGQHDIAAIIAADDPSEFHLDQHALRWRDSSFSAADISKGRAFFHSIGSCSLAEPVDDLRRLQMLK